MSSSREAASVGSSGRRWRNSLVGSDITECLVGRIAVFISIYVGERWSLVGALLTKNLFICASPRLQLRLQPRTNRADALASRAVAGVPWKRLGRLTTGFVCQVFPSVPRS